MTPIAVSPQLTTDNYVCQNLKDLGFVPVECRLDSLELLNDTAIKVFLITASSAEEVCTALEAIHARWPLIPVIVGLEEISPVMSIASTRHGAYDCVLLSSMDELKHAINEAINVTIKDNVLPVAKLPFSNRCNLVGQSAAMQAVYKAIGRVAGTKATVLIAGESGTGKELVAESIHNYSPRHHKPLVTMNCAAVPENLLESMMFGHEKGAFTGASQARIGKFRQADGGSILLDEIGELPLSLQAKLLRVIEYNEVEPLGSHTIEQVDTRILAATNRDLKHRVECGTFREDLYHRLNVVPINIPPLRKRPDDLPALTQYFLLQIHEELKLDHEMQLSPDALRLLQSYPWPGNARQLRHCLVRACVQSSGQVITGDAIADVMGNEPDITVQPYGQPDIQDPMDAFVRDFLDDEVCDSRGMRDFLDQMEKIMLEEALKQTGGNQTAAAKLLGVSRTSVQAKLKKHNIHYTPQTSD